MVVVSSGGERAAAVQVVVSLKYSTLRIHCSNVKLCFTSTSV